MPHFAEELNTKTRVITPTPDAFGSLPRRYLETDTARNEVRVYEIASIATNGDRTYRHVSTERLK